MTLTEKQKKKIEETRYQGRTKKKPNKAPRWAWVGLVVLGILLLSRMTGGEKKEITTPPRTQQESTQKFNLLEEVDKIEIAGKTIKVGDLADDVFEIVTDEYKIDSPTIETGKVTHHFLADKILFDMTFERTGIGNYYVLTKIVIKDRDYQDTTTGTIQTVLGEPPVEYEIGYSSGALVTITVPQGTTEDQLKELLGYFHSLNEKGLLSKAMKGHTVIDIFDDKKWTTKENYEAITQGMQYCDYIKATYSVGLDRIERAAIGVDGCPNYEEVKF